MSTIPVANMADALPTEYDAIVLGTGWWGQIIVKFGGYFIFITVVLGYSVTILI